MSFSVQSEVGRLRQVIVHRPGLELSRLSPQNVRELLFDEVMWASRAKEEHDAFAEMEEFLREYDAFKREEGLIDFLDMLTRYLEEGEPLDVHAENPCALTATFVPQPGSVVGEMMLMTGGFRSGVKVTFKMGFSIVRQLSVELPSTSEINTTP